MTRNPVIPTLLAVFVLTVLSAGAVLAGEGHNHSDAMAAANAGDGTRACMRHGCAGACETQKDADTAEAAFLKPALLTEGDQTTCPIMGGDIVKTKYADVNGRRVYVCCDGCIDAVKKDPAAAIKKLEGDGVTVATVTTPQTTCPVSGGPVKEDVYVDADGKRIYLCCEGCVAKVEADPGKYIGKLEKSGVTLAATPEKAMTD